MNTHELAWAAGFFDGEGHMHANFGHRKKAGIRKVYSGLLIDVAQKDPLLLNRFKDAMGVGYILGPYKNNLNQDHYSYRYCACKFEHVQHVVALMWTWLGSIKRAQCKAALLKYVTQPRLKTGRKPGSHCGRGHEFTPETTRVYRGKRQCETCAIAYRKERYAKRKGTVLSVKNS